jgi:hypothetical protein
MKFLYKKYYKIQDDDLIVKSLKNPEINALLLKFSESEYSPENMLCWSDIQDFIKEKDFENKLDLAKFIFLDYFNSASSSHEINTSAAKCAKLKDRITKKNITDDLFASLEEDLIVFFYFLIQGKYY